MIPAVGALIAILAVVPFLGTSEYFLHLGITSMLMAVSGTGWAMMGRFGLVSLGHGAFIGTAAYVMALLWNEAGLTPWLGLPIGVGAAMILAALLGYPCFRLRVVGHYFALVTLAAGEIVRLMIVALREHTGGSLGMTPRLAPDHPFLAMQFTKTGFWWMALIVWVFGLAVWWMLDRSMSSKALAAINEDQDAAAAIGIQVTSEKLRVTIISAGIAALGGALGAQYRLYLNPESLAGIGISLQIVFGAIAGGMYSMLGPSVGAVFTIALEEFLRVGFGTAFIGAAPFAYGVLLVLFILFLPRGIVGFFGRRR
ncbi:MAG: Amino acid/amide transporter rane protein 2, family [Rubritepida sp.]|nr:Amino acid/amide transporter rane protein 2, family [Rubritepida sp.]